MPEDVDVRGKLAAGIAGSAVVLAGLAVAQSAAFALSGAYLLIAAPLVGLPITVGVYLALHRICTIEDRRAEAVAAVGPLLLAGVAVLGISFGGFSLLVPAMLLAVAAVLTPRAERPIGW